MIAAARTRDFEVSNRVSVEATPQRPEPVSKLKPETKPDAPLTKVSRMLTAGIHASVLIGIVVFVILQLSMAATADRRASIVKVVASGNKPVSAPFDGVFHAAENLPKGTRVQKGQFLGTVESVAREDEINALRQEVSDLRKQRLMLRSVETNSEAYRDVSQKLRLAKVKLETLMVAGQRQEIYSPVDGIIELGLSGSQPVKQNDSIAQIWEAGGELLIEVEGPIDVLNQVLRKQAVAAKFDTDQGSIDVAAKPIEGSLKSIEKQDGQGTEIWGVVQCRPTSIPASLAAPGALGHL